MKNKSASLLLALLTVALVGLLTGCVSTHYKEGDAEFSRVSVGTKQSAGVVDVKIGDRSLRIEGYSNDQTETAAAVASAVAKALTSQPQK